MGSGKHKISIEDKLKRAFKICRKLCIRVSHPEMHIGKRHLAGLYGQMLNDIKAKNIDLWRTITGRSYKKVAKAKTYPCRYKFFGCNHTAQSKKRIHIHQKLWCPYNPKLQPKVTQVVA